MEGKETAILLLEFQNEFCSPDGFFYNAVKGELARQNTIENTIDLVNRARGKALIIHVPISFSGNYNEIDRPTGILKGVLAANAFRKGSRGAQIIGGLRPRVEDIVIEGKRGLGGFSSTNLDWVLRNKGIKNVAICGFLTNVCVESTARTAYDRGYQVTVIKDCTAATSPEEQKFAEEKIFPLLGNVMTYREFLNQLE